jgi:hypothetical protein
LARTPEGKRYNHQRRLCHGLLQVVARKLGRARLNLATDFDDLHAKIEEVIGSLHGVGELMVYDTALRIGAKLNHWPKRVYLHAGTRAGARALGLDWRAKSLPMSAFPKVLQQLKPYEVEDVLCIFKDQLESAI